MKDHQDLIGKIIIAAAIVIAAVVLAGAIERAGASIGSQIPSAVLAAA